MKNYLNYGVMYYRILEYWVKMRLKFLKIFRLKVSLTLPEYK